MKTFKDWCLENKLDELLYCYELANNIKKPEEIGFSAGRYINLKCIQCGLIWDVTPNKLNKKLYLKPLCPYCRHERISYFYNALVVYPELADYWDKDQNERELSSYSPKSHEIVHWYCKNGHTWTNSIKNQTDSVDKHRKNNCSEMCPYCSKQKISPTYNLEYVYPEVAAEWDYNNNNGLTPRNVFPTSSMKVSWVCSFNPTHVWKDTIGNRTLLRRGCAKCSKSFHISYTARTIYYYLCQNNISCCCEKRVGRYSIDLVIYPKSKKEKTIALELDGVYSHNSKETIMRDSRKDIFLREKGYRVIRVKEEMLDEDKITFSNDIITYPYKRDKSFLNQLIQYLIKFLSGIEFISDYEKDHWKIERFNYHYRKNHSIAVLYPDVAREWSDKNKESPDVVSSGTSGYRWWVCPKCHMEYQATISNRVIHHSACPYCAHIKVTPKTSLMSVYPDIAKEWDYDKNFPLTPNDVLPGTEKKVWWICEKGHSWKTLIYLRTGPYKSKCPVCQRRAVIPETSLYANNITLANLWDYSRNNLSPKEVAPHSNKNFFWKCEKGHIWEDSPSYLQTISEDKYCPICGNRKRGIYRSNNK